MESELPKALAPLRGKPMIKYIIDTINEISKEKPIAIIGYKGEEVRNSLRDSVQYVNQGEPLGTAHAVMSAKNACGDSDTLVILSADQPLIKSSTIENCIKQHQESGAKISFLTTEVPDFEGERKYFLTHGRILRQGGKVIGTKEYKDATEEEKNIKEVNTGCAYVFDTKWLWENITKIKNENASHEYYLTDIFAIASEEGVLVEAIKIDAKEALGANSKAELEVLENLI